MYTKVGATLHAFYITRANTWPPRALIFCGIGCPAQGKETLKRPFNSPAYHELPTRHDNIVIVYLCVQRWLGNDVDPTKWGWMRPVNSKSFVPIETTQAPAPPELLENIFCRCKSGCLKSCSCRKLGNPILCN